jgi:hypothetical protein
MSDTHDDQPLPHPADREPAEGGRDEVDEQLRQAGADPADTDEDDDPGDA